MDASSKKLNSLEDMKMEAQAFIGALVPNETSATLVTLSGELGAGKTTFTQCVAKALGITDVVNSPTFVIEKIYNIPEGQRFTKLVHIDAYRLLGAEDLNALGFEEIASYSGNLIFLEWPEQVVGIAEQATIKILLEILPDGSRQITYA